MAKTGYGWRGRGDSIDHGSDLETSPLVTHGQDHLANGQDRLSGDTYALVELSGGAHDGVVGEGNKDQGDIGEPEPALLDAARDRAVTRAAEGDGGRPPYGPRSCHPGPRCPHRSRLGAARLPELGGVPRREVEVSRAQAYRLLDVARALGFPVSSSAAQHLHGLGGTPILHGRAEAVGARTAIAHKSPPTPKQRPQPNSSTPSCTET